MSAINTLGTDVSKAGGGLLQNLVNIPGALYKAFYTGVIKPAGEKIGNVLSTVPLVSTVSQYAGKLADALLYENPVVKKLVPN